MVEEQVAAQTQELAHAGLDVEVIRDLARFNAIASEWDRLVDRWGVDRVFLSHAWFRTWWEAFGAGNELHVVTVRSRGDLVAAAPMMRTRAALYGIKADAIQSIYNPHIPTSDFVVGNNHDPRLYQTIWRELAERSHADVIMLAQVPENSLTIPAVEKAGKRDGWFTGEWIAPASPFISLGGGYENVFKTLRAGARYNLRRRYNRLNSVAPVDVEAISERAAVREAMKDGLRIEAAAWKGEKGTAIMSDPAVAEFYVRLAEREADLGQLRLTFLRVGGKRIAFNYLLRNRKRLYCVKIGYDPQFHSYSPGNMLLNLILHDACAEGMDEYDFLGADDPWKFEWTSEKRNHRWLFLFRNRLRPRLLHYLKFNILPIVKPGLRTLCTYLPGLA